MKLYLAHPITGLTPDGVTQYYRDMDLALGSYYDILQPMVGKGEFRTEKTFKAEGYGTPVSSNHAIFERDKWMVSQCDVILVDFENALLEKPYVGCTMELAWAALLNKHTIVVLPEVSPLRHAFILEAADIIFPTLSAAMDYLIRLSIMDR